jgi:anti-sigma factor ChrR (cupin superfamily)
MVSHLLESLDDPEFKIYRPRQVLSFNQIYAGEVKRAYGARESVSSLPAGSPIFEMKDSSRAVHKRSSRLVSKLKTAFLPNTKPETLMEEIVKLSDKLDEMARELTGTGISREASSSSAVDAPQPASGMGSRLQSWAVKKFGSEELSDDQAINVQTMQRELAAMKEKQVQLLKLMRHGFM